MRDTYFWMWFEYIISWLYLRIRYKHNINAMSVIESGPFAGCLLSSAGSWGGHDARLLGTYEMELWPALDTVLTYNLARFVDIGCADGYYACGFGLRCQNIEVLAYDLSRRARVVTFAAALRNNIVSRTKVLREFDTETFNFSSDRRTFVIIDCEGAESEIITATNIYKWEYTAILVECHDHIIPNITKRLSKLLDENHAITLFQSRARDESDYPRTDRPTPEDMQLMNEYRRGQANWILAIPKIWTNS